MSLEHDYEEGCEFEATNEHNACEQVPGVTQKGPSTSPDDLAVLTKERLAPGCCGGLFGMELAKTR